MRIAAVAFAAVAVAVLAARPAQADPALEAATRQLLTQIGDGTVPIARLIDPGKGVWVVDNGHAAQVCGKALLDVAIEVQVHADTWGHDAGCTNRARDARCLLPAADEGWGGYEVRFDRTATGLVLRALVRGRAGKVPRLRLDARCADAAPMPVAPAPVVATATRAELANGQLPTVATQAMLVHLAKGDWKLTDFADRERGLVIIDDPPGASGGEDGLSRRDLRVCGRAIDGELTALQARIADLMAQVRGDQGDVSAGCSNRQRESSCGLSVVGEWGPVMGLHFRQTARGLVLDAYTVFDEHQVPVHETEWHTIRTEQALAHAWAEPCPITTP